MEKEFALVAVRGLLGHIADGQSVNIHREGKFFSLEIQANDEPAI